MQILHNWRDILNGAFKHLYCYLLFIEKREEKRYYTVIRQLLFGYHDREL